LGLSLATFCLFSFIRNKFASVFAYRFCVPQFLRQMLRQVKDYNVRGHVYATSL